MLATLAHWRKCTILSSAVTTPRSYLYSSNSSIQSVSLRRSRAWWTSLGGEVADKRPAHSNFGFNVSQGIDVEHKQRFFRPSAAVNLSFLFPRLAPWAGDWTLVKRQEAASSCA